MGTGMTKTLFAGLLIGLMTGCAQTGPLEMAGLQKSDTTMVRADLGADHHALSKYFENAAREMQVKAAEQRKLLDHYEDKSYLYGRSAQDLKSHTAALIRKYDKTAEKNIQEAVAHRQMALEQARQGNLAARID